MKRLLLPLLLSTLGTIILFVGAAMHGGMCHCMTAMFALFPYGSFVMMMMSWDSFGLLLALLQFPVYAVIITLVNGVRRKMIVLLFIVILHIGAASFALRDYCQSRGTCAVAPSNNRFAAKRDQDPASKASATSRYCVKRVLASERSQRAQSKQSVAADVAIACFSSSIVSFSSDADRALQRTLSLVNRLNVLRHLS